MIVVEGPDGAGKTTLITELSDRLNLPVAPRVVSKDTQALVNLKVWTERNVAEGFQPLIFDRHRLISEPIYGSVLRPDFEPGFDDPQWLYEQFNRFYSHCRPIIIYCLPSFQTILWNLSEDEDNVVVRPKIRRIFSLYAAKASSDLALRPENTFLYDYTAAPYREDIVLAIEKRVANV